MLSLIMCASILGAPAHVLATFRADDLDVNPTRTFGGLIVVSVFLNKIIANIAVINPNNRIRPPIISIFGNLIGFIKYVDK